LVRVRLALLLQLSVSFPGQCDELRGRVIVNFNRPLGNAIVKIQAPGETVVTNTDDIGDFSFQDVRPEHVVISVSQDGRLLYRAISSTKNAIAIDLIDPKLGELPADFSPIGLSAIRKDDILIVENNNRVLRFRNKQFELITMITGQATDISAGIIDNQETFWISIFHSADIHFISQYLANGRNARDFPTNLRGAFNALAVDDRSRVAYLLDGSRTLVSKLDLATGTITDIYQRYGAKGDQQLTHMTLDRKGRNLYVSDVGGGLYALDLDHRRLRSVAEGLGDIEALAVDSGLERLYCVAGSRILKLQLSGGRSKAIQFTAKGSVKNVKALAVDENGTLWVGDTGRRTLLSFSPDGALLATLASKR
jgi:DNA-binding beta-propeller fold protein YncE